MGGRGGWGGYGKMGSCCSGLCATGRTLGACPMCVGFVCGCVGWWVSVRVESIEVAKQNSILKTASLQVFFFPLSTLAPPGRVHLVRVE